MTHFDITEGEKMDTNEMKTVGYTENANYKCLEDLQQMQYMGILNPLNLDYCGKEQCDPSYKFGPYIRENYVLHIVVKGSGKYCVGGNTYQIREKQAFLIYPHQETYYQADEEDPWEYIWIGFHGYQSDSIVTHMGFSVKTPVVKLDKVDHLIREMDALLDAKQLTYVNELKRTSYMYAVFALLVEENIKQQNNKHKDYPDMVYVRMAVDMIVQSYNKKLKISDIANAIGISRSYLTNSFKKELKMSPQTFLIQFRLEKAAQLLRDTSEPINNIAIDVGYPDSLSFSKAFKQQYKMSPSAYRQNSPELLTYEQKGDYVSLYHL